MQRELFFFFSLNPQTLPTCNYLHQRLRTFTLKLTRSGIIIYIACFQQLGNARERKAFQPPIISNLTWSPHFSPTDAFV